MLIARWRTLRRGDVVAIFLLAAITGIAVIAVVKFPNLGWTDVGSTGASRFGPDWECSYPGQGDPVRVKKPAPMAASRGDPGRKGAGPQEQ